MNVNANNNQMSNQMAIQIGNQNQANNSVTNQMNNALTNQMNNPNIQLNTQNINPMQIQMEVNLKKTNSFTA